MTSTPADPLAAVRARINAFRDEREWRQFHTPKNLATSVVIEAAELLELFQWSDAADSAAVVANKREQIADEIADVAIYLLFLADDLGIDLLQAIETKMDANARKYPVERSRGRSDKYTEL